MNDPIEIAIGVVIVASTIGGLSILGMLVRALLQRWAVKPHGEAAEVTALRERVAQLADEVGELQERVDFTERVLSQHDRARVEGGERR